LHSLLAVNAKYLSEDEEIFSRRGALKLILMEQQARARAPFFISFHHAHAGPCMRKRLLVLAGAARQAHPNKAACARARVHLPLFRARFLVRFVRVGASAYVRVAHTS
jgi:hypothetical protein